MSKRARTEVPDITQSGTTSKTIIPLPDAVLSAIKRSRENDKTEDAAKRAKLVIPPSSPNIVPVRGNSKVQRCTRCNTFVKKGAAHTEAQCNARIASKKNRKAPKTSKSRKIRITPKRKDTMKEAGVFAAEFLAISKPLKSLQKYVKKHPKSITKGIKRQLNSVFQILSNGPEPKRANSMLRKMGVI